MNKKLFEHILKQLNKEVPSWHSTSTEFGGVSNHLLKVDGLAHPILALIYNRKVFGIADNRSIYIDKDSCNTSRRIAFILKRDCYYQEIVEL